MSTVNECDWKPDRREHPVVIVGEVFKAVKQEADCHADQIDEVLFIPVTIQINYLRYSINYQTLCYNVNKNFNRLSLKETWTSPT